jgi:hypothetical protein
MESEKIDLFEVAVRYLAIKPIKLQKFDFADAEGLIKQDKQSAVTFIGEHGYFEKSLEAMLDKVTASQNHNGTIYVNIQGLGCSEKIKKRLFYLSESAGTLIIFGNKENWPRVSQNIRFSEREDIFSDNHQRFFIYHSSGLNIALISRHDMHDGVEMTEAVLTNDPGAVTLLGVTIGTKAYPLI